MSNVIIDINTTINAPVINIEESIYSVAINSEVTTNNNTINVNSTAINNVIEVDTQNDRVITIDIQRGYTPDASDSVKGKMKLYNELGVNIDGSVNQNIIKTNLDLKVDKISGYSLTKNNLTDALKALYDSAVLWISINGANLVSHLSNINNPHSVTKSQIGLSDVPNTNFTSAVSLNTSKTGITTSQASDIVTNNQKISYTNSLSDLKVDKESGKSLVLDTEIAKIPHANRSSLDLVLGTNTGDQDLSNLALITYVDSQDNLKVDKEVGKSLILDTEVLRFTKFSGGQAEIDFGALPIYQKEFTITDASVLTTSNITASIAYEAPTGKDLDEIEMDSFNVICGQATNGTFKIIVKSIDGSYLADKFKINYSITT